MKNLTTLKNMRDVINPATGEVVGAVPAGNEEDVRAAVDLASGAFGQWSLLPPGERGKILFKGAYFVREKLGDLAALLTSEQGKPLGEAKNEIMGFANVLEYYSSISGTIHGDAFPKTGYGYSFTTKTPLGVCGAIIPWNMPALIMAWKIGPALTAGNTMVLKPATTTPLTNLALADILVKAGLPEGVLNIVTGSGEVVGEEIVRHPEIKKISFTGAVETGKHIAALASGELKRVTLELGGSDPMIVCKDADIEKAVAGALNGRFYNCGQTCTAVKRLYLSSAISDEFIKLLTHRVSALKIGNGFQKGVNIGPLHSSAGRDEISGLVRDALLNYDCTLLSGGKIPDGNEYKNGFFYEPTVLTDVPDDCPLVNREVFGPVLPVMVFDTLNEAIEMANRTEYGLGASVWTKDLTTAASACEALDAGIVWVNQHLKIPPDLPFGGEKASGVGRENGYRALDRYLKEKTILVAL